MVAGEQQQKKNEDPVVWQENLSNQKHTVKK
jgi:hypothetical protein